MLRSWIMFLPVLIVLSAVTGRAEEKIKVGEVVITASKLEEAVGETTSEVIVIKDEDIKKMNVLSVPDVFRKVPDLNLVQSGGDGNLTFVFLRGGAPRQTLVMIDGVKVNSNTAGAFDFYRIPVEDIERIEIVKGSQSTIYGSEAMAGVIHIITKKGGGKMKVDSTLEIGAFNTLSPSVTVSGGEKNLNYRVTGFYYSTSGISAAKSGTEKDGHKNAYLSWNLGYKPSSIVELELLGNYASDRTELDGFDFVTGKPADALAFVQHGNHFLLSARGRVYLTDKWEQILTLSTFRDTIKSRDPETAFNNSDAKTKRQTVDWQNNIYLSEAVVLTAGIEYRKDDGEFTGAYDQSVDNKAGYLNSKVKLIDGRLVLNAGVRYDDHETAGSKTTYKVGAAYNVRSAGLTLKTSYGTGFLAPTFDFLFFEPFNNPNLKPEESKSFDMGVVKTFFNDRVSLSATYFNVDYTNLIQGDPANNFRASNIAKAEVNGLEILASARLTDTVDVRAGYTYLDTEDKITGSRLLRRPNNKLNLGVGYTGRNASLLADLIYVGERLDIDGFSTGKLPPYYFVNLSGSYKVSGNVSLFARIENLLDRDYEETLGFGTKGTSVYGGIRVTL